MKKSRLSWCVYAALSLTVLMLSVCEIKRNNPLDESGNTFVQPQIIVDTIGAGVSNGDTIHFDSATVIVSGNRTESRFQVSIDSGTWSSWQSSGKFHFDSLADGKHAIVIESKYDGGTISSVYDTIVFHVLTIGYKPKYQTHLDSIIQTDTGSALLIVAEAEGMKPIAYQWKKGDSVLAGGNKDTLNIPNVQSGDSGSYSCVASNEWGVDVSRLYKIKVVIPPPPTYSMTYDDNRSTSGTVPIDANVYKKGAAITVKANIGNLIKTGYSFVGWNAAADGSGTSYAAGVDFNMGQANVVLYAKWTQNPTYSLTYNGNGNTSGTVPADANAYEQGATVTVKGNTGNLANSGYSFVGWNTAADGSGTSYAVGVDFNIGTNNVILYAKWTQNQTYTVTYNGNGNVSGTVPADVNAYVQGSTIVVLGNTGNLVKTGYTFIGWSTTADGSGTSYATGTTFSIGSGNVILYAKWTQNPTYTVAYNGNGSTSGSVPIDANAYLQGATVTVKGNTTNLVKTGYSLAGWTTTADGSGTMYTGGGTFAMATANVTLYAKWAISTFAVTFNSNGGTGVAGQTVVYDSMATQPTAPTKTGYGFSGWYSDSLLTNVFSFSTPIMMATTLYAKWTINTYTASFNSNGGSVVANQTVSYNSTATLPTPAPTRIGYGFSGWYSDSLFANAFTFSTLITAATTLYAKWVIGTYTFTFNSNGGSAVSNQTVAYNSTATLPTPAPTRTGYGFSGWCSDSLLTNAFSFSTPITATITLYAKWTINMYTVTFNANGGSTVANQTVAYNSTATVPTPAPTRTGYGFSGWYSDSLLTNAFSFSTPITAATTLYAKWLINTYTVSFNSNGGSAVANQTVAYNSTATLPAPPPTRAGYDFSGWYSDSLLTNASSFSTPITAATTLYAKWTINQYKMMYNGNGNTGGTAPDATTHDFGTTVTVPANTGNLVKTGYLFGGWNTMPNGTGTNYSPGSTFTMGAANDTLFAKWNSYTYTITFDGQGATTPANPTIKTVTSPATTIVALPPPPSKTGYIFGGWFTAVNGGGTEFTASSVVTASDTVYAKWNITYTVTFDDQSATTLVNPKTKTIITPAITIDALPTQPSKTACTFSGWYTAKFGGGTEFKASTVVTADITIYANWTVTDIDGNVYHITTIGDQSWMVENLQTTKVNDGTAISLVTDATAWSNLNSPGYCWYDNNLVSNKIPYGALYNWHSVGTGKLAPTGWRVASDSDWAILGTFVSSAGKLKEAGTSHWSAPNTDATNETGFSALPGGYRYNYGTYSFLGQYGHWWTSAEKDSGNTWNRDMHFNDPTLFRNNYNKKYGFSVRCIQGGNQYNVTFSSQEGSAVLSQLVISGNHATEPTAPTRTGYTFSGWYKEAACINVWNFASEIITDPVTLYAKWVVQDVDGNVYTTVTIGTQTWMVENLKTIKFNDGSAIPLITDPTIWASCTTSKSPGYCWYANNEAAYQSTYGPLYNWYAVGTGKLAPAGWHVPTDAEWDTLQNYLIANGYNWNNTTTGNKTAKSLAAKSNWRNSSTTAGAIGNDLTQNNRSGFSALPCGTRYYDGNFYNLVDRGYWWSSTEYVTSSAWLRDLYYDFDYFVRETYPKSCGWSVRLLRDY